MNKYPIKYNAQQGEFSSEDLAKENAGGCDKLIIGAITDRGVLSASWTSLKADGGPMHPEEVFKCWVMLGVGLMNDNNLSFVSRQLCEEVFNKVKQKVIANGQVK